MSLGHQGDITKIVVTASDSRYEVVEGYEEGLNMARRWRAAWNIRGEEPRGASLLSGPARPAAASLPPSESRPLRPSNRHPIVSVGSFGASGASADRPTLPGPPEGLAQRSVLPPLSTLSEEPTAAGERPRPSRAPRPRPSSLSSPPLAPLAPLSPATLAPPTQLPELPMGRARSGPPAQPAPRLEPAPPLPGLTRARPPGSPSSPPGPPAAVPALDDSDDGSKSFVVREFGNRGASSQKRPPARSVPGAAREPGLGQRPLATPDSSAETRGADEPGTQDMIPPRPPRR